MKILLESNDLATFASEDGKMCGGTIIGNDDDGFILQTGPQENNIEVIQKSSIRRIFLHDRLDEMILSLTEFGHINPHQQSSEPYIPPPPRSMSPIWDRIAMVWRHPFDGVCNCGCKTGGESSSDIAIVKVG
ncbi:hypothetical protein [Pseudomonas gozinkensis]|uniref:hypothetical protein n=1 Tax=Pseudomonas gozinkensis TaxID=2774461 RepID=UPI0017888A23|nr:hypothetical protein [Pseudomonas gozinkensis]